jgi:cbb3-type cytochrome oxidase subunit 3
MMSIIDIAAAVAMFLVALGVIYAAYSYKLQPDNKKHL